MPQFSLAEISAILKTSLPPSTDLNQKATGISTDTRSLNENELFIALRGEQFDGHNFVEMAAQRGATALIVERRDTVPVPQFVVEDTLVAYQKLARWWRERFKIPVVAVTGSVGKTTTKELIAAVLSLHGSVLKTQANYNNEIGVPKTLLGLEPQHDYAVIEMAMRATGEIALLTQITRPTIGVITNVGTAHIGRLGSKAAIAQAKCELLAHMPRSGVAILNADDRRLMETAATVWQGRTITYGLEQGEVRGELIAPDTLRVNNRDLPLPLSGRHNALNTLAAIAVATALNLDIPTQLRLTVNLPGGRSRRYQLPNDVVVLDETYNAGLESMLAALHLLKETPGHRHIAVLGTMKELGDYGEQFHQQVGAAVRQLGIERLLVLIDEPATQGIAQGAAGVATQCFTSHGELANRLSTMVQAGDRILFKASNSVGLSKVVEEFCAQFSSTEL